MEINQLLLGVIGAVLLGISKSGLKGIDILIVSTMAIGFGAKESTGILVPLLIIGDIMAVIYYHRHAQWKILLKFLPWMITGVLVGAFVGRDLDEFLFKKMMSIIIIFSVFIMFWWERKARKVPQKLWFAGITGTFAGFTTMVGNLAGAFSNIYFLAMRIPKDQFIGTAAWLFFIINLIKVPFHIFSWHTINENSLRNDLLLIPFVIVGFLVGVKIVSLFKDRIYRLFILFMTAFAAIILLIQ